MPVPHHSNFLQAGCSSWRPTNKALKASISKSVTSGQRILMTGDIAVGKFNVTLDCFGGQPVGTHADSRRVNFHVRANGNGARRRTEKSRRHSFSKVPLLVGIWTPSTT